MLTSLSWRTGAAALALTAGFLAVPGTAVVAAESCTGGHYEALPGGGRVYVCVEVTSPGSAPEPPANQPASTRSHHTAACLRGTQEVACSLSGARWSNAHQCYVHAADPQPAPSAQVWDSHRDAEGNPIGAIYICEVGTAGDLAFTTFWAATNPVAAAVDPGVMAQRVLDELPLLAPRVGATPLPGPDSTSLVGLPTWLWVEGGQPAWGPYTHSATAGGITLTLTARALRVVFDMGDGHSVTCTTPGTPWTESHGSGDSPTCGYRYLTRGERTITATTHWQAQWSGAGQTGTITFDMSGQRHITVAEMQPLVTNR